MRIWLKAMERTVREEGEEMARIDRGDEGGI